MSDNLHGIFDHLTPGDFDQPTTAIHAESQPARPDDEFDRFVSEQLIAVRYAFAAADGLINPVATLASASVQRFFAPEDSESLGQYVARLTVEARVMRASWLFISRKSEVGVFLSEHVVAPDDVAAIQAAREQGRTVEAVYWYAERVDGSTPPRRHGFLTIVGNHLGENVEHHVPQVMNLFAGILGGSGTVRP